MTVSRPTQGGSPGTWGTQLDAYMDQFVDSTGVLVPAAVRTALGGLLTAVGDVSIASDTDVSGAGDIVLSSGGVERGRISAAGVGTGVFKEFTVPGSSVFAIGDSITSNGNGSGIAGSSQTLFTRISATSYLGWAALQSSGKLLFAGASGTSGYTIAQVRATHVPVAIAANAGMCVVLAGTNDMPLVAAASQTIQTTVAGLKGIYTDLLAASILPICCTIPPHNAASANENKARAQLNTWICAYAAKHRLPFVDFYGILADPATAGNYLSTLNTDATHPNAAGAKAMGLALYNALQPNLSNQSNPMLTMNNGDTGFGYANSLFLTDTNADGIPDNWTLTGTGATGAIAADAAIKGNYWKVTRGSADAAGQQTATIAFSAGDVIYVAFRPASNVKSLGATFDLQITDGTSVLLGLQAFAEDITPGATLAGVITVPAGATSGTLRAQINVKGVAAAWAEWGQLTVMNMTTNGLDVT